MVISLWSVRMDLDKDEFDMDPTFYLVHVGHTRYVIFYVRDIRPYKIIDNKQETFGKSLYVDVVMGKESPKRRVKADVDFLPSQLL